MAKNEHFKTVEELNVYFDTKKQLIIGTENKT